jgi:hypothetical protein
MNYPDIIQLVLTYKHDHEDVEIFTERVDAEKCGDYYKLITVPAFAKNIAYGDIVKVEFDDGEFHFDKLIKESGFSVVHIVIWKPACKDAVVNSLDRFRCGVNTNVADNYLVISIPPTVFYPPVQTYLLKEKASANIDFRESSLSRLHATGQN